MIAKSLAVATALAAVGASALTLKKEEAGVERKHHHHKHHHHGKKHHHKKMGWTFKSSVGAGETGMSQKAMAKMMAHAKVEHAANTPMGWSVNAADYSNTMTLTATVEVNGVEPPAGTLAAFVSNSQECRGVMAAPMVPPFGPFAGSSMYLITLYGDNSAEDLSFAFQPSDGTPPVDLDQIVKFKVNGNKGNVVAPFRLSGTSQAPTLTTSGPPTWAQGEAAFNYAAFENSMTLTTTIQLPSQGGLQQSGTLAAFSKATGELRGVENQPMFPPFGPYGGQAVYPLMVYGHGSSQGEAIEFKFFDGTQVFDLPQETPFMANDNKGNVVAPLCFGDCMNGAAPPPPPMPAYAYR